MLKNIQQKKIMQREAPAILMLAIYFSLSIKTFAALSDPLFFSSRRWKDSIQRNRVNNAELHSQTKLSCGVSRVNEDGIQLAGSRDAVRGAGVM
jgi:type II secretory pathway component PulM